MVLTSSLSVNRSKQTQLQLTVPPKTAWAALHCVYKHTKRTTAALTDSKSDWGENFRLGLAQKVAAPRYALEWRDSLIIFAEHGPHFFVLGVNYELRDCGFSPRFGSRKTSFANEMRCCWRRNEALTRKPGSLGKNAEYKVRMESLCKTIDVILKPWFRLELFYGNNKNKTPLTSFTFPFFVFFFNVSFV